MLSHNLPPAPSILVPSFSGEELDRLNTVIEWEAISGIVGFEIIVENEDVGAEMTIPLSANATSLHIPEEFLDPDTRFKVEVLAIAANGNKTIAEREFVTQGWIGFDSRLLHPAELPLNSRPVRAFPGPVTCCAAGGRDPN